MSTEKRSSAASDAPRVALHRRVIEFDAYDEGDAVSITGRLRDERPWARGTDKVEHVHDMDLSLTIRKDDLKRAVRSGQRSHDRGEPAYGVA